MVPFRLMVYAENRAQYVPVDETEGDDKVLNISGTELRRRLREDLEIPEWFSFPDVVAELKRSYPPRHRQGFVVFFTGLPASGKSTVAGALMAKLLEVGGRRVSLLDGDEVRRHLSGGPDESEIRRLGFVAGEIARHGGIALCAPVAPDRSVRERVRESVEQAGTAFVEVYVATPPGVCEARAGQRLRGPAVEQSSAAAGTAAAYEESTTPEVVVDTSEMAPDLAAHRVLVALESLGLIR